jgi:tetratricopeptide repeat protein 30
MQSLG